MKELIYVLILGLVVALIVFIPSLFTVGGWLALKTAGFVFGLIACVYLGLVVYDWIMSMFNRPATTN